MAKLSDDEVLALEKILVKDNKIIRRIGIKLSQMGAGNTNTSGSSVDQDTDYTLDYFSGRYIHISSPFSTYGCNSDYSVGIAAVVEDVLYVVEESNYSHERRVKTIEYGDCYCQRTEIAYDTLAFYSLKPKD